MRNEDHPGKRERSDSGRTRMKPKILARETVYSGYLKVQRLGVQLDDGADVTLEVERHGDAAVVLPYDAGRRCALVVRLFRVAVFDTSGEETLEEACAGMIGNEDAVTAARREAYEELGVDLKILEPIGRFWSSPGVSTERHSLFLAPYAPADRTGAGGGVAAEHEHITVVERPLVDLSADLDRGRIADGKLALLVFALRARQPRLFSGPPQASGNH
jgi:nudix-type nucleoside diphosphatase (YffH/AdpP family)